MDTLSIQASIDSIADFILKYAITLAALGALTVGLLEAYKKLFGTLARFQQDAVRRWLAQEVPTPAGSTQLESTLKAGGHYGVALLAQAQTNIRQEPYDANKAYAELVHLTTGIKMEAAADSLAPGGPITRNVSFALFELDLARMMAQIQEAADAALSNPTRYGNWFAFLTRGADPADVDAWVVAITSRHPPGAEANSTQQASREQMAEVYARIRLLMRRQLDSFQTVTSYRWREWNQLWAWAVGGVLLLLAQMLQAGGVHGWWQLLAMAAVSMAGGILAPVAKDLVDALAKVKSGG